MKAVQKQISAAVVYRISDKSGKCLGYKVPSDTEGQEAYEVTYNYTLHRYECNCKCGIECNHTKECKHLRAVKEVCEIRNQVVSTPLTTVMEQAHDAMVAFDRDSDPRQYVSRHAKSILTRTALIAWPRSSRQWQSARLTVWGIAMSGILARASNGAGLCRVGA